MGKIKNTKNSRRRLKQPSENQVNSIVLTKEQEKIFEALLEWVFSDQRTAVLRGFAGTGKSTIISRLLSVIPKRIPVAVTAPTHKAVRVLREFGADAKEVCTIHALLGLAPQYVEDSDSYHLKRKRPSRGSNFDLVIVDEASMIGGILHQYIIDDCTKILFVGDPAQLPPVGELLSPSLKSADVEVDLFEVVRQAADHPLISLATDFRCALKGSSEFPDLTKGVEPLSGEDFEAQLIEVVDSKEYSNNPDHVRALAWTNQRVGELNCLVRNAVYGERGKRSEYLVGERLCANSSILKWPNVLVSTGEIVTVCDAEETVDDYGVPVYKLLVEAEAGKIACNAVRSRGWDTYHKVLSEARKEAGELEERKKTESSWSDAQERARRAAWVRFFAVKEQYVDLRPPFASTVHKSQGMTLDQAFIDVSDIGQCTRWYDALKLMYVALTRARFRAVVTGVLPDRIQAACYAEWSQAAKVATGLGV